jgi:ABC-type antimicrobial peptide transport system permease subunit
VLQRVVAGVDWSMPITHVSTLEALISDTLARDRMLALLSSAIGGLATYVASSKVLGSLLFQLSPTDATTLASGLCMLAIVTVAAAFVPARRATRLDPAVTLRRE